MWSENRDLLIRGARSLGDLREKLVFVGGCTTGLLISDPAAADVRSTRDVGHCRDRFPRRVLRAFEASALTRISGRPQGHLPMAARG